MKSNRIILILMFILIPTLVCAHELQVLIDLKPPFVALHSQYSENESCSYAEVSIFSPHSNIAEFQIGYADKNGNFSFLPDSPGIWKIKIDDGMGHVKNVTIEVTEVFLDKEQSKSGEETRTTALDRSRREIPDYLKAIFGMSLIVGITGIIYWIKANKVMKNREKSLEA
jgi:nickel transport protein